MEIKYCLNCNKEIPLRNKFCNNICQGIYEFNSYINEWKKGNKDGIKGKYEVSTHIKRYLFEKYNNRCQKCKWGETNIKSNKVPLQIHHIDGDCLNNKEDNLELLCPNCHSLTETYGNLNKNSQRVFRKQKVVGSSPIESTN